MQESLNAFDERRETSHFSALSSPQQSSLHLRSLLSIDHHMLGCLELLGCLNAFDELNGTPHFSFALHSGHHNNYSPSTRTYTPITTCSEGRSYQVDYDFGLLMR
jgi:hypothetical protein